MPTRPSSSSNVDKYRAEYEEGVRIIAQYGSGNTTYSHKIGSCVNLEKQDEKSRFFDMFTENGMPVYIIGVTNNIDSFDDYTKNVYVQLRSRQKEVMLGQWTGPGGVIYRDVLIIVSGIGTEQALKYKRQYSQISILEIRKYDATRGL